MVRPPWKVQGTRASVKCKWSVAKFVVEIRVRRKDPRWAKAFSVEHAHEVARRALLARALRVGAHVANGKCAARAAGSVHERSVPQVVVKKDRFARLGGKKEPLRFGFYAPHVLVGNDAAERRSEPRLVTPGDDFHAAAVRRCIVERRPDLEEGVPIEPP